MLLPQQSFVTLQWVSFLPFRVLSPNIDRRSTKKCQATPTKQDHNSSLGIRVQFPMNTPVVSFGRIPPAPGGIWLSLYWVIHSPVRYPKPFLGVFFAISSKLLLQVSQCLFPFVTPWIWSPVPLRINHIPWNIPYLYFLYTTAFLYSDWLYVLWHGIKYFTYSWVIEGTVRFKRLSKKSEQRPNKHWTLHYLIKSLLG